MTILRLTLNKTSPQLPNTLEYSNYTCCLYCCGKITRSSGCVFRNNSKINRVNVYSTASVCCFRKHSVLKRKLSCLSFQCVTINKGMKKWAIHRVNAFPSANKFYMLSFSLLEIIQWLGCWFVSSSFLRHNVQSSSKPAAVIPAYKTSLHSNLCLPLSQHTCLIIIYEHVCGRMEIDTTIHLRQYWTW